MRQRGLDAKVSVEELKLIGQRATRQRAGDIGGGGSGATAGEAFQLAVARALPTGVLADVTKRATDEQARRARPTS